MKNVNDQLNDLILDCIYAKDFLWGLILNEIAPHMKEVAYFDVKRGCNMKFAHFQHKSHITEEEIFGNSIKLVEDYFVVADFVQGNKFIAISENGLVLNARFSADILPYQKISLTNIIWVYKFVKSKTFQSIVR